MRLKEAIFAFIFFVFITLIFFNKIFLGLIPLPSDLIVGAYHPWLNYKWVGYEAGVPVNNPKLSDAVSIIYPLKILAVEVVKQGHLPLWNPYMFGGYPLYASVLLGLLFPTTIFYFFFSSPIAWTLQVMSQPILALFFMYLFLRYIKLGILPSVFGSIIYGFGGSTILWIQWNTQATTSLFLPILILLEDKYLTSKSFKWGVLFSIFICFQIFAGYLPIIPFTFIAMFVWYLFRSNKLLSDLKIIFYIVLGILLSAVFLLPVAELIQVSQRTVETLGKESPFISFSNLIYFLAPDFFGNDATGNFWGSGDHMDFTLYTGVTALVFALMAIKQFFNNRQIKFAVILFIVTLMIVTTNPLSVVLHKLGLWGGASITMNRANFLFNFSISILAAYGVSFIKESYSKITLKPALLMLLVVVGIIIGLLISKLIIINGYNLDQTINHINISLRNLILPVFIIIIVLSLLFITKKFKLSNSITISFFILILIFELFRFGLKFNTFSKIDYIYPKTPISNYLEKYPNDRIIAEKDVFPANMWVPFKISSMAGYDGIYPLNIAQLLASANSNKVDVPPQTRWGLLTNFNSKIIDETNTRFLVAVKRDKNGQVNEGGQVDSGAIGLKYKEVFSDKGVAILENIESFPRVYLTKYVIKASDKETIKLMLNKDFPTRDISISDFKWENISEKILDGKLSYKTLTNSHTQIVTKSNIDSYLVVLDSFYPGWKALVDGKETQIHRTNYNFRGILLPKGEHTVDFIYNPISLKIGAIVSGLSLLVIIILLIVPKFRKN